MKKRFSSRMKIEGNDNLKVMYANNVENIEETALEFKPKLIIIDSINTMGSAEISGDPGGTSQMKHSSARLINLAKENGFSIILVAQVNKDEAIAGPKSIEHMVDTVLYLEGEKHSELRLLRSTKNRFGSDNEVGVFKMVEDGLIEIENPSEYLLENRSMSVPGSAIACVSDTRPLLIEVQALVSAQSFENSNPRRTSEGFSRNRLLMIIAILEKHLGLKNLASRDVFLNVVGGITIREPGTDLGVAMSVYSSATDFALPNDTVFIGELGLAGEVRPINKIEQLIKEAERVGFKNIYIPAASAKVITKKMGIKIIPVKHISELKKKTK
jgi:DNA repair protein RadA/Sms